LRKDMQLKWSHGAVCCSVAPIVTLLGGMLVGRGVKDGSVCGIHTMRTDDTALSLILATGYSFVVRLFHWSRIEPLRGENFWECPHPVVRALIRTYRPH